MRVCVLICDSAVINTYTNISTAQLNVKYVATLIRNSFLGLIIFVLVHSHTVCVLASLGFGACLWR